jgi:uncharacterized membrane protein
VIDRRRGGVALAVAASVAFAVAAHMALVDGLPAGAGALLCLVPLGGFALLGIKRLAWRLLALAAIAVLAVASWNGWGLLQHHFTDVFFLEHVGINLALAFVFGRTLAAGRDPLVTRFARVVHGTMSPALLRYTRQVTVAWTVFFLAIAFASVVLYAAGFMAAWSLLANLLNPLLVAAMFVGEYAIRHRVLPDVERIGVMGGLRAFTRHFATRPEAPR